MRAPTASGLRPLGLVLRARQLQTYFQCCCALRGRPAGPGAPRDLTTAFTFLDRAARAESLGPIAAAAAARLGELRRPAIHIELIERSLARAGFAVEPPPPPPGAARLDPPPGAARLDPPPGAAKFDPPPGAAKLDPPGGAA